MLLASLYFSVYDRRQKRSSDTRPSLGHHGYAHFWQMHGRYVGRFLMYMRANDNRAGLLVSRSYFPVE